METVLSIETQQSQATTLDANTRLQGLVVKPLAVILSPSGKDIALTGSKFTLSVTISNKGKQSAIIEVYIEDISPGLRQWCEKGRERLALGPDQGEEVVFEFQVPANTLPGTYSYMVVLDAPEYYPEDTPIRYEQYIEVLPATVDAVSSSDPTFFIQPATNSTSPAVVQAGSGLAIQVLVQNLSDRVDRLRLVCSDLPKNWYTITYPQGFQGSGLVVQPDSLNLNPGESGQILLVITPPVDALAGSYVPTLQLYSENCPDLTLLDLVYLQVPPNHLLQTEMRSVIGRVKNKPGLFQVRLTNAGNAPRQVLLQVNERDEDRICNYILEQSQALIQPKQTVGISLQVQPTKWWRRPFIGGAHIFNFSVDLQDAQELPLPSDNLPGVLVWEARPWWQFLPFLLLGLLGLGAIGYGLWWMLFRIPPSPQIFEFYPEDSQYSAVNGDVVHLGFSITDANRLQSIKIAGLSADGSPLTRPETFDFSQGLPSALKPFCTEQKGLLTCRHLRSSARKPGTYIFEMTALPKQQRGAVIHSLKTTPVAIAPIPEPPPIPQPLIVGFGSQQAIYQEISNIAAFSQPTKQKAKDKENTDNDKQTVNDGEIRLNLAIANPLQLQSLQTVGRTPDGLVVSPRVNYDFSHGIPPSLSKFCKMNLGQPLVCLGVKTGAKKPGDYIFELKAIPKGAAGEKQEIKKTDLIKILPKPARILDFKINGKTASAKHLIPITPGKPVRPVILSWNIDASEGTKVDILPAPGTVPLKGFLSFTPDPKPSSTTLMLQMTTTTGQQIARSVMLETYDPNAKDPAEVAATAVGNAIAEMQKQQAQAAAAKPDASSSSQPGAAPAPGAFPDVQTEDSEDDTDTGSSHSTSPPSLFPVELPPQFDKQKP